MRYREVFAEEEELTKEWDSKIEMVERDNAELKKETETRHWQHQDEFAARDLSDQVGRNPYLVKKQEAALKGVMLEILAEAQELEMKELEKIREREVKKWTGRMKRALMEFDAVGRCAKVKVEEIEKERIVREKQEKTEEAEWKWFEDLWVSRVSMLNEDLERWTTSGGDAPDEPELTDLPELPSPIPQEERRRFRIPGSFDSGEEEANLESKQSDKAHGLGKMDKGFPTHASWRTTNSRPASYSGSGLVV